MRVLEPHHFKNASRKPKKRGVSKTISLLIIFCMLAGGMYLLAQRRTAPTMPAGPQANNVEPADEDPFTASQKPLKDMTGEQFKRLYLTIAYPNTQEVTTPPAITGNKEADARIRAKAEARGYRLTTVPMGAIIKLENEPRLAGDDLLQPLAAASWYKMREAARQEGYPISLISAYRSPEYQRKLFTQRLYEKGVTVAQLANGTGDAAIEATLGVTAVPGYSRHHTGYTVDLWCEDGSYAFLYSKCYEWISANNYQHAMEFGWIPSYPEGTDMQGPEPEPWEYVWVGNAVREQ